VSNSYLHDHVSSGVNCRLGLLRLTEGIAVQASLVGHSDRNAAEDTGHLHVTYAYNHWNNINSRAPSFRFGTGHVYKYACLLLSPASLWRLTVCTPAPISIRSSTQESTRAWEHSCSSSRASLKVRSAPSQSTTAIARDCDSAGRGARWQRRLGTKGRYDHDKRSL